MSGYQMQTPVPDTSADMNDAATRLAASCGIARYMSMMSVGPTVWVLFVDDPNPSPPPTAAQVVGGGFPLYAQVPVSLQPVYETELIDPSLYWLATASGDGAGDVRTIA